MLVPVARSAWGSTGRPVAARTIPQYSALAANGPSTTVGPSAPIRSRQVAVIMAR